jgi:hypothetical protein
MQKEVIIIDVKTEAGRAELKKLQSGVKGVKEETKEASGEMVSFGGTTDKLTGGAISKFTALKTTLVGTVRQLGLVRLAVIGTGIGLLVLAVASLKAAFTSSEEGQNKFTKIMGVIGAITGNLITLLSDLGMKLISVFENPKQALKDFGNLIKENIVNRFQGLIELIPQLGKAINLLFRGQFSEAGKVAVNAVGKVALGVEDVTGKIIAATQAVKGFIDENIREANIAASIADKRAKADKGERDLLIQRAEANRRIAELREKAADKLAVGVEERIKALIEAGKIEEGITLKEIANSKLRLQAKIAENALANSTKEDLLEEAQLRATLIDLETARLTKQKSITAEVTGARREALAEQKALEAEAAEIEKVKEETRTSKIAAEKELKIKVAKEELDAATILANELAALELKKVQDKENALNAIIGLVGQETALGKAAFLAKQIMNIQETIAEAKKTIVFSSLASARTSVATAEGVAQTAKVGFPQNIPLLIGYAAQAIGIIGSVKSAISSAKSVASGLGGSGSVASIQAPSTPAATAPSFNIVGQSGTNQLAESIGSQEKKPLKAYVVSGDVTTAQAMERNIIASASI